MKKVHLATVLTAVLLFSGCTALDKVGTVLPEGLTDKPYTVRGLQAAVDLGLTLKCTYAVNDATYEGYIKGKQWRGKISTPQMGMAEVIIQEDGCMYSWDTATKQGVKMCFDPEEMWESQDTMTDIEYNCSVTTVGDDMFTPPSDVTYIDPMAM